MIRKNYLLLIFTLFSSMLIGCFGDLLDFEKYKDLKINPSVAIPLGFASFSVQDLITSADADAFFEEEGDGTLVLLYEDSIQTPDFLDELEIEKISFTDTIKFNVPHPVYLPPDTSFVFDTLKINMSLPSSSGRRIDSLIIDTGFIEIITNSNLIGTIKLTILISGIRDFDNNQLVEEIIVDGSPDGNEETFYIDISDSHLNFTSLEGENGLSVKIIPEFISDGGYLTDSNRLILKMEASLISVRGLFGYLGNEIFKLPDKTIHLDFFKTFNEGSLNFGFPNLLINMISTIGIPISMELGVFYTEVASNEIVHLSGPVLDSQVYILPQGIVNQSGVPNGKILVNPHNSSFRDVFPRLPGKIVFDLISEFNPGEFSDYYNYLYDTSDIYATVRLGIPLRMTARNLEGTDTTEIDWGDTELDYVKKLAVKVRSDNGLPFGGGLSLLFLDEENNVVLDLFDGFEELIIPAETDDLGIPVNSSIDSIFVELTDSQIDNLFNSTRLVYYVILNTDKSEEDVLVSLTRASFLNVSVGVKGDLELVVDF